MGYGSFWPTFESKVIGKKSSDGGSTYNPIRTSAPIDYYPKNGAMCYSRSGTNRNSTAHTRYSNYPPPEWSVSYKKVAVTLRRGPRLNYRIWNSRLRRFVWARQPITVWRLRQVRSRVPRVKKLSELLVNDLSYSSIKAEYWGDSSVTGRKGSLESINYTGDLWRQFAPINTPSSPILPAISDAFGSIVSGQYASTISALDTMALDGLYEKTKNQHINLAQVVAERRMTVQMICDILTRVVRAVIDFKRGNLRAAWRTLFPGNSQEVANDWLMWQYGVKPLIADLQGAVEQFADDRPLVFDVISKKSREVSLPSGIYNQSAFVKCTSSKSSSAKVTVTYKARIKLSFPGSSVLSQLGLTNWLSLAYEVTPYSFVLDWLWPLGDYLNNQDAFMGAEVLSVHRTIFIKEKHAMSRSFGGVDTSGYTWESKSAGFKTEKVYCERKLLSIVPPLRLPNLKDPVSITHVANAAALITQLLRRR